MTSRARRHLARLAVAALLAGGVVGALGHRAYAVADPAGRVRADLAVAVAGTTVAAGASGKAANVTVTNHGPGRATGVTIRFDLADLDPEKARFSVPEDGPCRTERSFVSCDVIDIAADQAVDLEVRFTSLGGGGAAGSITATVGHPGIDDRPGNNAVVTPVVIGGAGPDLYVYAPDVPVDPDSGKASRVKPGRTAKLRYAVGNHGDVAVGGVRLRITLPKHVTFARNEPGCTYAAGRTAATCTYEDMPIVAADADASDTDQVFSLVEFYNTIKVAKGAPAPAALTGGEIAVESISTLGSTPDAGPPGLGGRATAVLPAHAEGGSARDVDASDNTDEFVVYVARRAAAGDSLPITGAPAAAVGWLGLAVTLTGVVLLLAARRRTPRPRSAPAGWQSDAT
jgi:hypothetical protein